MVDILKLLIDAAKTFGVTLSLLLVVSALLIGLALSVLKELRKALRECKDRIMQLELNVETCHKERVALKAKNNQLEYRNQRITAHSEVLSEIINRQLND